MHRLYDSGKWVLLPELSVVEQVKSGLIFRVRQENDEGKEN
jgi:hypothetical protein